VVVERLNARILQLPCPKGDPAGGSEMWSKPMDVRAVLFDLDGTLLDTLADIASAANEVLERHGLPAHPAEAYRRFIGDGVAMLFRRALPPEHAEPERVARCVADFREAYGRGWNVHTRPYAGISELLDALVSRGLGLTLLSNKPDDFTRLCASAYLARWPFRAVLGQREGTPRKPDPAGALEIVHRLGVPAGQFLYVGDSAVDMETARRAGMRPVGVSWGFRPAEELWAAGAEAVIAHPAELLEVLGGR
jgi:phosphoglycolate phosphatase